MFKHEDLQMLVSNVWYQIKQMSNFRPFEVVGRGSKTQLQVGENLNYLI